MKPKALVLRAPGTNCDRDSAFAFEQAGGDATIMHINQLMESPQSANDYQVLIVPGGFSYGDDIGAGRVWASQFTSRLKETIEEFRAAGKLVLGICNGFQVLIKTGFLVAPDAEGLPVTLTWNESGKYDCRWVHLKPAKSNCVFLRDVEEMYLPIAHAEGRFVIRNDETLAKLNSAKQVALKYVNPDGSNGQVDWPHNPNGSDANIAGVCDESGHVFGLMPHPERFIDRTQHPHWTRCDEDLQADGLKIFTNAVQHFA